MQWPVYVEVHWASSCTELLSIDAVDIRSLCLVSRRAHSSQSQAQEDSTEVGTAAYHEGGAAGIVQEDGGVVSCLQGRAHVRCQAAHAAEALGSLQSSTWITVHTVADSAPHERRDRPKSRANVD